MTTEYRPIECDAYDQIEIGAMRRSEVEVTLKNTDGRQLVVVGKVLDTAIHDAAEYLVLGLVEGSQEIRLDHIQRIYDPVSAFEWRQKAGGS